jgi:hypothetical protein
MARKTTGTEVTVSKTKEEITKEAMRIEESTRFTAKSHYNDSAMWGFCHILLGLPTTVLSAIVAVAAFQKFDSSHNAAGIIALIVAGLGGLITFLNPNQKSAVHKLAANGYDSLSNRVRVFRTIDCWGKDSDFVLTNKLKSFSEMQSKLNSDSPQPSLIGYFLAKLGIKRGEADFAVDTKKE